MSDRQSEIVETALRLISDQGIQELTMKKIAAAVGISEPAIYRHFESKFDILSAVVDEMRSARAGLFLAPSDADVSAEATIAAFFAGHARLFTQKPSMTVVLFSEDLFRNDAALSERIFAIMRETRSRIEAEIERGIRSRSFRADLDAGAASLLLVGGFRQLVSFWRLEKFAFSLDERTAALVAAALSLFAAP